MVRKSAGCALVALGLAVAVVALAGCTSRWAVRGNVDLTGDGTAAPIGEQATALHADPWPRPEQTPAPGV